MPKLQSVTAVVCLNKITLANIMFLFITIGAFVLPFLLMLVVTGIPLFFLETAFGQYASCGVVSIWKAAPLFQGKTIKKQNDMN